LSAATGGQLGPQSTAVLTIIENDAPPSFTIDDVTHDEGNGGTTSYTFTVTKTGATAINAQVNYETADNTATTADGDYIATSGTLTFGPNDTTMQFTVQVNGDLKYEDTETFFVNLTTPVMPRSPTARASAPSRTTIPFPPFPSPMRRRRKGTRWSLR